MIKAATPHSRAETETFNLININVKSHPTEKNVTNQLDHWKYSRTPEDTLRLNIILCLKVPT